MGKYLEIADRVIAARQAVSKPTSSGSPPPSPLILSELEGDKSVSAVFDAIKARCEHDKKPEAGSEASELIALFEKTAALHEAKDGWRRSVAERRAFGKCVEAWCRCNPHPYNHLLCAGCGRPLGTEALDLPDGSRVHFESHRNYACVIAAGCARKRRAVAALVSLGLLPPEGWDA